MKFSLHISLVESFLAVLFLFIQFISPDTVFRYSLGNLKGSQTFVLTESLLHESKYLEVSDFNFWYDDYVAKYVIMC